MKLAFPGQSNSQTADGNTPAYNNIMGVFNISNKPTVHAVVFGNSFFVDDPYGGGGYEQTYTEASYTLDNNSFQLIWNPAIINSSPTGATIQNLKKEIVVVNVVPFMDKFCCCCMPTYFNYSNASYYGQYHFGSSEQVGNLEALVADAASPDPLILDMFYEDPTHLTTAVRISFDVVPNNSAPTAKIVKTFLANVQ